MGERIVTELERLRRPSEPVEFGPKAKILGRRLHAAANSSTVRARGIAAPQIGVLRQMFYWNFVGLPAVDGGLPVDRGDLPPTGIACNPRILSESDETWVREEGCLSFRNRWIDVIRPVSATFEWFSLDGERREVSLSGYAARIWMHESDHLAGILMIDRSDGVLYRRK